MSKPLKIQLCDECRYDGGQHFDDEGNATRPHLVQAKAAESALRIVELAHEEQTKAAREIVKDGAERMLEFSANNVREEMHLAGVEGPVIGAAFTWAETEGLIEPTGRGVKSTESTTRHRINIWRSLVHRGSRVGAQR